MVGILQLILESWDGVLWIALIWLRRGTGGRAPMSTVINLRVP
jgi:hypothetical protein